MASEGPGSISHLGLRSPKRQRDPSKRFLHICKEGHFIKESGEHGRSRDQLERKVPNKKEAVSVDGKPAGGPDLAGWHSFGLDTRLRIAHHTISIISVPEMWGFRSAANPAHRLK